MIRGVTLVELVVTLAIAGIAAGVAVPALGALLNPEPHPSAPAIELLDRARRTAIERSTAVTLVLVPATGRYWVWTDERDRRSVVAEGVLALPAGASLASAQPRVRLSFNPLGQAFGDPLVIVTAAGFERIVVDRWTGVAHAMR